MLKIQVLGNGLIPRGYGLAPRKDPFQADLTLIRTILSTAGLKVNMIHPETNRPVEITNQNLKRMWDTYNNYDMSKVKVNHVPQTQPALPSDRMVNTNYVNKDNPHNVTPVQVGLANGGNTKDAEKPVTTIPTAPVVTTTPPAAATVPPVEEKNPNAPVQTPVENKKEEPIVGNQNDKATDAGKPGFTVKPINADDHKNNNGK